MRAISVVGIALLARHTRQRLAPKYLTLTRQRLHHLLAICIAHGDFSWYHTPYSSIKTLISATLVVPTSKAKDHLVRFSKAKRKLSIASTASTAPPHSQGEGRTYLRKLMESAMDFAKFLDITARNPTPPSALGRWSWWRTVGFLEGGVLRGGFSGELHWLPLPLGTSCCAQW